MPTPHRIGIDARFYSSHFTGIGRYTAELVARIPLLAPDIEFVVFLAPEQYAEFLPPAANVRAVAVTARHYSVGEQTGFLKALRAEKLDVVHFTHFNAPLLYQRPSVVTIHDLTLHRYPGKKMTKLMHRAAYHAVVRRSVAHARRIIAVSEHTKQDILEFLHTDPHKIAVVHNGIGDEFVPAKKRGALPMELATKYGITQEYLLYTGVWRDHKNLLGLLEAVAQMQQAGWQGQLVLTGRPDAVYAPELHAAAARLGVAARLVCTGLVPEEELLALYQHARVYVFPSFYEGFGFPPLEAMACGTAVAVSRRSSLPEVCGEAAAYFDPENPGNMARVMSQVWTDDALRQRLQAMGIVHAKKFRWEQAAEETLAVYRAAL